MEGPQWREILAEGPSRKFVLASLWGRSNSEGTFRDVLTSVILLFHKQGSHDPSAEL